MKNTLIDLNNHLFSQLERLNDESLKVSELTLEIQRAEAMAAVAKQVIGNASIVLKAERMKKENLLENSPSMLESDK